MDVNQQLDQLYKKLQLLLQQYNQLQKANKQLQEKLAQSEEQKNKLSIQLSTVQQKLDVIKIVNGQLEVTEKKDVEKRINQYIKDIDACIDTLIKKE